MTRHAPSSSHAPSRALAALAILLLSLPLPARAHGDLHDQITTITAKLRKTPGDAALTHKRGELHRAHGDYAAALADYAHAERLDPTLTVVRLSRGRAWLEQAQAKPEGAQLEQAVRALDAFLSAEPEHPDGLLLRARALVLLGQRANAERDFVAVLMRVADPIPDLFLERAQNLRAMGALGGALSVIEEGLRKLGSLITLEDAALELEVALGRFDAALSRIDRLVARTPRKETLLARKAEFLDQAGRPELARAARAEALAALAALPPAKRKVAAMQQLARALTAVPAPGSAVSDNAR